MNASQAIYDVAIVGLGPTGLTLAHLLGRRGHRVLALEREPEFYGNARAVYTDDECMRIFQAAGVAADLEADMLLDTPVRVLEDGSVLAQLRRTDRPYGWAVSNFFYQPYLETRMERLLARYPNVTVMRGRELVNFAQDGEGVVVEHAESSGSQYRQTPAASPKVSESVRVRAQWLVACDGGRSGVRTSLGIKMAGKSFPEPWLVVDIKAKKGEDCFRHIARPDQGADGGPRDRPRAPFAPYRRRQGRGAAATRVHVQCARRRAMAGRPRVARGRRRAYDAAIHGPGDELWRARRAQSRLEARRRAARRSGPETGRYL